MSPDRAGRRGPRVAAGSDRRSSPRTSCAASSPCRPTGSPSGPSPSACPPSPRLPAARGRTGCWSGSPRGRGGRAGRVGARRRGPARPQVRLPRLPRRAPRRRLRTRVRARPPDGLGARARRDRRAHAAHVAQAVPPVGAARRPLRARRREPAGRGPAGGHRGVRHRRADDLGAAAAPGRPPGALLARRAQPPPRRALPRARPRGRRARISDESVDLRWWPADALPSDEPTLTTMVSAARRTARCSR